jgi:phosphoribosylanthranilate isomerase
LKFPLITVTGADERTDLTALATLTASEDCEVGILYSANPEGRNRYPRKEWIIEAAKVLPRTSIHICGRTARAELSSGRLDELLERALRIQVNGDWSFWDMSALCKRYRLHSVINQIRGHEVFQDLSSEDFNHQLLVDSSGGRGVSPDKWVRLDTNLVVGYAGGLGPDNLRAELPKIVAVATAGRWWVDMESSLRVEDWFSLERASEAIGIFHDIRPRGGVA